MSSYSWCKWFYYRGDLQCFIMLGKANWYILEVVCRVKFFSAYRNTVIHRRHCDISTYGNLSIESSRMNDEILHTNLLFGSWFHNTVSKRRDVWGMSEATISPVCWWLPAVMLMTLYFEHKFHFQSIARPNQTSKLSNCDHNHTIITK